MRLASRLLCRRAMKRTIMSALVLSAVTACATTQTTRAQLEDQAMTRRVNAQLRAEDELRDTDIDVDTIDGVVYLRGAVPEPVDRVAAHAAAHRAEGVVHVMNQLSVEHDQDAFDANPDAWITTLIETKLATNDDTKARNIDVDTEDRVVTLSGIVEDDLERQQATRLALTVEGVRDVDNQLQVGHEVR